MVPGLSSTLMLSSSLMLSGSLMLSSSLMHRVARSGRAN